MFQLTGAFTRRAGSQKDRRPFREAGRSRHARTRVNAEITRGGPLSGLGTKARKSAKLLALLACAFVLSAAALTHTGTVRAQVLYGSLTGNVTDSAGAAVRGATVAAVNAGTNVSKETVTNEEGIYQFSDLLPG